MVRSSSYIWCDGSHVLLKGEGKHKTEQTKDVTLIRSETLKGRSWGKGGLQRNLERPTCLFPDPTSRLSFITLFLNRLWALWSNVLIKTKVGCDLFWPHGYCSETGRHHHPDVAGLFNETKTDSCVWLLRDFRPHHLGHLQSDCGLRKVDQVWDHSAHRWPGGNRGEKWERW